MKRYWRRLKFKKRTNQTILEYACALPFLRADLIEEGVSIMTKMADDMKNKKMDKFIKYVRRWWLPLAHIISLWNVQIRTNNIAECYHMHVNKRYGRHPRLWKMLSKCIQIKKKNN